MSSATTSSRPSWRLFDDQSRDLDRFGLLLIVTVVTIVMLSLVDIDRGSDSAGPQALALLATVLVGATLLLALRASGVAARWLRIAAILVGVIVLGNAIGAITQVSGLTDFEGTITSAPAASLVVLAALAPVVVVRRLLRHRVVRTSTLLGAIAAYLLIPVAYFYAFSTVDAYAAEPFFGVAVPTTTVMYFSLSTITTLGYGDYGAVGNLGRLLATSEAVVGQIYLVTFVAMIVGLLAQGRSQRADEA